MIDHQNTAISTVMCKQTCFQEDDAAMFDEACCNADDHLNNLDVQKASNEYNNAGI